MTKIRVYNKATNDTKAITSLIYTIITEQCESEDEITELHQGALGKSGITLIYP